MPSTEEQRLDLIENCNLLLDGILLPFEQTDDTPEGRMITQLKWLKERAENYDLPLPVDPDYLSTIRYVYTDGELCRHASDPKDKKSVAREVETPMGNIIELAKNGRLLYKSNYKTYVKRCIDALIHTLNNSSRSLSQYEQGLIPELDEIKKSLIENTICPPLGNPKEKYPNYLKVDTYHPSIEDLPEGKFLIKRLTDIIFDGVRPDSWLTPELADQETEKYLT